MSSDNLQLDIPIRKTLPHEVPAWVPLGATFFLTINCAKRGTNQLASPEIARALLETIVVRMQLQQWYPRLVLFMPDHVHGLVIFGDDVIMKRVVQSWKRYAARYLKVRWQRDFFDRRIRKEESLDEKWDYIVENPVRAGLVSEASAWPYIWRADDLWELGRDGLPNRPIP